MTVYLLRQKLDNTADKTLTAVFDHLPPIGSRIRVEETPDDKFGGEGGTRPLYTVTGYSYLAEESSAGKQAPWETKTSVHLKEIEEPAGWDW